MCHILLRFVNYQQKMCNKSKLYMSDIKGSWCTIRRFISNEKQTGVEEYRDPRILIKKEIDDIINLRVGRNENLPPVPRETDIAIIGGGAIGMSVAYWLKRRFSKGFNVTVIEKDTTYSQAATTLSLGGLRQQFSLPENIQMSLFTAEFLRDIKSNLAVHGMMEFPDVQYNPQGYLFLASEQSSQVVKDNYEIQCKEGSNVELLSNEQLKAKFPWMNVDDIAIGSYGLQNEGWFDPYLLLAALKLKCASLDVQFVKGEVVGFKQKDIMVRDAQDLEKAYRDKILDQIYVRADGKDYPIKFAYCVNCAGPWAGKIARMAGIGEGKGIMATSLPVEPRKRYVYLIHCPDGPGLNMPFLIDNSGAYVRREGITGHYLCGLSPSTEEEEPDVSNLDVDYHLFEDKLWPILAHRIPAFQSLKLKSAWAGYYDYNVFDQNLIIGAHPYHDSLYFACGSSGHGIQHAVAIGRAVMELIIDSHFTSIDLRRFNFERIINKQPIYETNII